MDRQPVPTVARTGDRFDNEGFAMVADHSAVLAHPGQLAAVWIPGRTYASSVSVQSRNDGTVTLHRDGKGDTVTFDFTATALGQPVPVTQTNGRIVAFLRLGADRERGQFVHASDRTRVTEFCGLAEGLVRLAGDYIV